MAKFVCAFLVVVLMAVTANALKCYDCSVQPCAGDDKTKWNTMDCAKTIGNQKSMCLTQVIEVPNKPERVVRKCAIVPEGKSEYQCVDAPGEKTTKCQTCDKDLCNSAGSITFSVLAFASVIMPFLVSKFLIH